MRQLRAGEMLEVVDWRKPFVKLADGAGFVEDPDFDGHRNVTEEQPRWAPRVSGTVFRLHGPNSLLSSAGSVNAKAEVESSPSARPDPLSMSEHEMKSEVCGDLGVLSVGRRFTF